MGKVRLCDTFLRGDILCFKDYVVVKENRIIFSACNYNGLYQYDWEKNDLRFLGSFINENLLMKSLHGKIVQYNQQYIFIPYYAKAIDIYDMEKDMFYSMELPLPQYACHSGAKFQMAGWYRDKLYLFPENYSYILEIDLEKDQLQVYDDWNEEKLIYQPDVEKGFGAGYWDGGRFVYLPMAGCNKILRFDLDSKEYKFITIETACLGFCALAYAGKNFYAADKNGRIIRFQVNGGSVTEIGQYATQFYHCDVIMQRYILFFPNKDDAILVMDTQKGETYIHKIGKFSKDDKYDDWEYNRLWFVKKIGDRKIAFMDRKDRALKVVSISDEKKISFEWGKIIVDNTEHAEYEIDIAEYYGFWTEYHNEVTRTLRYKKPFIMNEKFSTEDTMQFLFKVVDKEMLLGKPAGEDRFDVGSAIWEGMKNALK